MALAHGVGDKTEQTYARSDLFEKRRKLMEMWSNYTIQSPYEPKKSNIIKLSA